MKSLKRLYTALVFSLLYLPLLVMMAYSFNRAKYSAAWQGFTLKWYRDLWQNDALLEAFFNSLTVAMISSLVATLIGILAAVAFFRYRFPGRKFLFGQLYVVMLSPDIMMGISLLVLFILIGLETGSLTLCLSHITFCLPFVVVTIHARISDFDRYILEAARDLGASEYQMFRHVLLPMMAPAVISGWLLSFTLSLDDVVVSFFVTGPGFEILPLKIYSLVRLGVTPEINALSTVMIMITLIMVGISQFLVREKHQ